MKSQRNRHAASRLLVSGERPAPFGVVVFTQAIPV